MLSSAGEHQGEVCDQSLIAAHFRSSSSLSGPFLLRERMTVTAAVRSGEGRRPLHAHSAFVGTQKNPSWANTPDVSGCLRSLRASDDLQPRPPEGCACGPCPCGSRGRGLGLGLGRGLGRGRGPYPGMSASFQRCSRAPPATFRTGADISADGGGSEAQRFVSLFGELNCTFPLLCSFHRLTSRLLLDLYLPFLFVSLAGGSGHVFRRILHLMYTEPGFMLSFSHNLVSVLYDLRRPLT